MNIHLELTQGKRVLHVVLEEEECMQFDRLLNFALNTKCQQTWASWLDLEAKVVEFLKGQT